MIERLMFESHGYVYSDQFLVSVDLDDNYRVQMRCEEEDLESLIAVIGTNESWRLLSATRIGRQK